MLNETPPHSSEGRAPAAGSHCSRFWHSSMVNPTFVIANSETENSHRKFFFFTFAFLVHTISHTLNDPQARFLKRWCFVEWGFEFRPMVSGKGTRFETFPHCIELMSMPMTRLMSLISLTCKPCTHFLCCISDRKFIHGIIWLCMSEYSQNETFKALFVRILLCFNLNNFDVFSALCTVIFR